MSSTGITFASEAKTRDRQQIVLPDGWYPHLGGPGVKLTESKPKPNKETGEITAYNAMLVPMGRAHPNWKPWGKARPKWINLPSRHPTWENLSAEGLEFVLGWMPGCAEDLAQLVWAMLAADKASARVLKPWPRYDSTAKEWRLGDNTIAGDKALSAARRASKEACEKRLDQIFKSGDLDILTMDGEEPRQFYARLESKAQDDGRVFPEIKEYRPITEPPDEDEIIDIAELKKSNKSSDDDDSGTAAPARKKSTAKKGAALLKSKGRK